MFKRNSGFFLKDKKFEPKYCEFKISIVKDNKDKLIAQLKYDMA